ncbi:MAG: hypothetical protein MHMPM18_002305 [Marteilia pararefringens]
MNTSFMKGIVIEKDVLHQSMKRTIANTQILLLSDSLEYKKGESHKLLSSKRLGIWNPYRVKYQICKTALDTARMIINIDEIVTYTASKRGLKMMQ